MDTAILPHNQTSNEEALIALTCPYKGGEIALTLPYPTGRCFEFRYQPSHISSLWGDFLMDHQLCFSLYAWTHTVKQELSSFTYHYHQWMLIIIIIIILGLSV